MNINYLLSFIKELKALKSTPYFKPINTLVFEEIHRLEELADLKNLKKLQGYENAYRIRESRRLSNWGDFSTRNNHLLSSTAS